MLKDKPTPLVNAPSNTYRRKRTWVLTATLLLLCLIYYYHHRPSGSSGSDSRLNLILNGLHIDWSRFAYTQYATDMHYLCNSIMLFESLHRLGSRADRVLFYPQSWDTEVSSGKDRISQLLVMARDTYKVKLHPTTMYTLKRQAGDESETTWDSSVNKLRAFELFQYDRVLHIDSDVTLFQHLDELFLLPATPVAMPRAYWQQLPDEPSKLTSLIVLAQPSQDLAQQLWNMASGMDLDEHHHHTTSSSESTTHSTNNDPAAANNLVYDMEILNQRFGASALVLPHRPYALVTGEFRRPGAANHTAYLGDPEEVWDPDRALKEAKLVHFSDWPLPKPWVMWPYNQLSEIQPACEETDSTTGVGAAGIDMGETNRVVVGERGCRNREVWKGLYDEFRKRRKDVCRLLSVPAPDWPPRKKEKGKQKEKEVITKDG